MELRSPDLLCLERIFFQVMGWTRLCGCVSVHPYAIMRARDCGLLVYCDNGKKPRSTIGISELIVRMPYIILVVRCAMVLQPNVSGEALDSAIERFDDYSVHRPRHHPSHVRKAYVPDAQHY